MTTAPSIRPDRLHLIAAGVAIAVLALAAYIWRFGPAGPIPMHIGIHGQVDGWGHRGDQAFMIVACTAMMAVFYFGLLFMARREAPESPRRRGLRTGRIVVVAISTLVATLSAEMTFAGFAPGGPDAVRGRLMTATLSAILLVIGALIGKAGPNPFVGAGLLSFIWSFKSRQAWDKSGRLKGRLYFWIGLAGLVAGKSVV